MEHSKIIQMPMDMAAKTDGLVREGLPPSVQQQQKQNDQIKSAGPAKTGQQQQQPQQQLPQKTKRKHRRGKPKAKNSNKPYKKSNYFQMPRLYYNNNNNNNNNKSGGGGGSARAKLVRSRSLVPYNTNKFLMEEHLADVPCARLTPRGRTRDSSFSMDSEDNYFYSLPEDEEEFLTKEFANVYEKARVERLENLTQQQLIEECLQLEDRYSSSSQQQLNVQRLTAEYAAKMRTLEEKMREISRENYNLRCQLMRSAAGLAAAAAASPPSAAAPTGGACTPSTPMVAATTSEDSESDSSSSSSSSSSSDSSRSNDGADDCDGGAAAAPRRRRSCSSARSSLSEYNAYIENNYIVGNGDGNGDAVNGIDAEEDMIGDAGQQLLQPTVAAAAAVSAAHDMDEDSNTSPAAVAVEVEQLQASDDLTKPSALLPTSTRTE